MQHKSHKAGISSACIVQRSQQGYTICELVHLSERQRQGLCTCLGMNGISQYLIQGTKMCVRGCAGSYGLRESLPGQWGGCGSKAVSYAHCTWTHIFEAKLTFGHARQHSTALPKILVVTVCEQKPRGRACLNSLTFTASLHALMHTCTKTKCSSTHTLSHKPCANTAQGQNTTCGPLQK